MASKTRYGTWSKNFGQSVKFSAKSVLTEITPNISRTMASIHNDLQELRKQSNESRNFKKMLMEAIDPEGNVDKYSKETLKNIKDAIATGKINDPERAQKLLSEMSGFDFDFNFDNQNDGDIGSVSFGPQKVISNAGPSASMLKSTMSKGFTGTNTAIARGFQELNNAEKSRLSLTLAINQRYHGASLRHLNAIEQNSAALVKFNNESMSVYVQGSLKYYDDSLEIMKQIRDAVVPPEKKSQPGFKYDGIDDIYNGGFSIQAYINQVKKNFAATPSNPILSMITQTIANPMGISDFIANPLGQILQMGMKRALPASLRNKMSRTDDIFSEFLPAALDRLGRYNGKNSLLSKISEIFGITRARGKDRYQTNQYERGPIPYDGESKKALTEVIPSYLSKIAYSLDVLVHGKDNAQQVVYDWSDNSETGGKFITMGALRNRHSQNIRDAKLSGYSNSRWDVNNAIREIFGYNSDKSSKLSSEFEKLLIDLVDTDKDFDPKNIKALSKYFGDDAKIMAAIFAGLNPATLMNISGGGRLESRQNLSKYYYNNALGGSNIANTNNMLYNGIYDPVSNITGTKYFQNDPSLGIYKNDNNKWTISPEALANYNRRYNTNFKRVEDVMKDYKSRSKNSSSNMEQYLNDTAGMSDEEKAEYIKRRAAESTRFGEATDNRFSSAVGKMFKSPLSYIEAGLAKVDNLMYRIVFGMGDDDDSIFKNVIEGIKGTFSKIGKWMETNIFDPIKQRILGSEIAQKAKKGFKSFFMGEKDEKSGKYDGGIFSSFINGTKDVWADVKKEWNESIYPKIQTIGDDVKEYIFGKEDKDNKTAQQKKPVMETVMNKLREGFDWWSSVFFGKGFDSSKKDQEKSGKVMLKKISAAMPKGIQGGIIGAITGTVSGLGGFGVLGSLFLPGGPIGGAIVGTALGFASQSKKFREMLFGKDTVVGKDKDGNEIIEKTGGLISDRIQKFFKGKRSTVVGGAVLGTGSYLMTGGMAFGLMPSLAIGAFGPIIAGAAMGLATHSETLRNLIFGSEKMDKDGTLKRVGGIINKESFDRFKKAIPRSLAGAIGSVAGFSVLGNMGLIGSMFALGPVPAALTGAGIGILSASKDFTDAMFGYTDKKGEYHEGMLGRMRNFFMMKIFKPLSLFADEMFARTSSWFKRNIAFPIADAFIPIKVAAKKIGDNIVQSIEKSMNQIGEGMRAVFTRIGERVMNVFDKILTPLQRFGRGLMSMFGSAMSISAKFALMPLTVAGGMANAYVKGGTLYDGFKTAAGTLMSGRGFMNPFGYSDEYSREIDSERAALKEKKAQEEADYNKMRSDFSGQWANLTKDQEAYKSRGWRSEVKRLQTVDKAINTSTDPNVVIANAQLKEQQGMSGTLTSIKEYMGALVSRFVPGLRTADDNAIAGAKLAEEEERQEKQEEFTETGIKAHKEITGDSEENKKSGNSGKNNKKPSFFNMITNMVSGVGELTRLVGIGAGISGALMLIYSYLTGGTDEPGVKEAMAGSQAAARLQRHGLEKTFQLGRATYKVTSAAIGKIKKASEYKGVVGEVAEAAAKKLPLDNAANKGNIITKALGAAKSGIESLLSKDGMLGKIASQEKLNTIKKIFTDLIDTCSKPDNIKKLLARIPGSKIIGSVARVAGSVSPIALGFGIYDAVTGLTRTAELFDVAEEDVDWTMRIVSTFLNVLFGYSWFSVLDICLSIFSLGVISMSGTFIGKLCEKFGLPLKDFDHHKLLARLIYCEIVDDGSLQQKQAKKSELEAKAQKAIDDEYNKYIKDNKLDPNTFTKEDYTKQRGEGIWNKYFAGTMSRLTGTNAFNIDNGSNKNQTLLQKLQSPFEKIANWFNKISERFEKFGFLGMAKLLLGIETDESLQDKLDKGQTHELSVIERLKYFFRGNKTEQEALRRAGFTGSGYDDEEMSPTERNKVADTRDKSSFSYYWTQNDKRYANLPVAPNANADFGTIGQYGCAPTAMSMVASMFNGYPVSPVDASRYVTSQDLYYGADALRGTVKRGIKESYFSNAAPSMSLKMEKNINSTDDMKRELLAGKALILGGQRRPGQSEYDSPFTEAGHYVVAKGYNPNRNTVSIYDPLGKNTRSYNIGSLFASLKYANSFAASFSSASGGVNGGSSAANDPMALNPEVVALPPSVVKEKTSIDTEHLTPNAKEALEYMGKYHRYLTGRPMTISSAYRTYQTAGDHATGNCFDVVDDRDHTTLENNENGVREKMIKEAGRVGIKVLDEYVIDTENKDGGHLHMDATNWQKKPYNNLTGSFVDAAKKGVTNLLSIFGDLGSSFMDMALATIAGKKWTPKSDYSSEGNDGIVPATGEHTITPKEVYKYYKDKQYSDTAIAAIMGNIMRESSFSGKDVAEYDSGGSHLGGVGLFQWNGVRTQRLKEWARDRGYDYQDPGVQMAYMFNEVGSSYKNMLPESFNGMAGYEDSEDAAAQLATAFGRHFEGCEDPSDKRTDYARQFYRQIKNGEFAGAGMGQIVSDYARTQPQAQLNIAPVAKRINASNLSANSIIRSAANTIELVNAIQRIDVHDELHQMIEILKVIAASDKANINLYNQSNQRTEVPRTPNVRPRGFNDKGIERLIDSLESNDTSSGLALAYEIAKGGRFRQR